jgi:hypothetical protein
MAQFTSSPFVLHPVAERRSWAAWNSSSLSISRAFYLDRELEGLSP